MARVGASRGDGDAGGRSYYLENLDSEEAAWRTRTGPGPAEAGGTGRCGSILSWSGGLNEKHPAKNNFQEASMWGWRTVSRRHHLDETRRGPRDQAEALVSDVGLLNGLNETR